MFHFYKERPQSRLKIAMIISFKCCPDCWHPKSISDRGRETVLQNDGPPLHDVFTSKIFPCNVALFTVNLQKDDDGDDDDNNDEGKVK